MTRSWTKSEPLVLNFTESAIDAQAGVIKDVILCQAGPAKGHGVHLEESFIEGLVDYSNKHYATGVGLKARFGHPSMSDSTMGSQMGYFKNIRKDDDKVRGDLHLLNSAELSPKAPQMRSWMLSMASEAEEFVMSSIVFMPSGHYQYDPEDGSRVEIETSSWGDPIPKYRNERVFVDFDESKGGRLLYCDLVEAGAATNSLFSEKMNPNMFAVRAARFVRDNEDIHAFLKANPQKLVDFAKGVGIDVYLGKPGIMERVFGKSQEKSDTADNGEAESFGESIAQLRDALKVVTTELASLRESGLQAEYQWGLERQNLKDQIKALQDTPAGTETLYETKPSAPADGNSDDYLMCELTKKAMRNGK